MCSATAEPLLRRDASAPDAAAAYALARPARWFAQKHRAPTALAIVDRCAYRAPWGEAGWWLLLQVEPGGTVYSLTLAADADGAWRLTDPAGFIEAVRAAPLFSEQGAALQYKGALGPATRDYALLDGGDSSNSLFRMTLAGESAVAKFFRKLDGGGADEVATIAGLRPLMPALFGRIDYRPARGASAVLASFMEYIPGDAAYRPYQAAARAVLAGLHREAIGESADDDHALPEIGARIGGAVAALHALAEARRPDGQEAPPLILADRLAALVERCERLGALIAEAPPLDGPAPAAALPAIVARLRALAARAEPGGSRLTPSFGHGDLHLSHILLDDGACRIIDPARALTAPRLEGHGLTDLFQLHRGFECFAFDEAATAIERAEGLTRDEAAARLALAPADGASFAGRCKRFAFAWPARVFAAIEHAYRAAIDPASAAALDEPAWRAVFYLERLAHEMDYNLRYDRRFFRWCDLASLDHFARRPAASPLEPRPIEGCAAHVVY